MALFMHDIINSADTWRNKMFKNSLYRKIMFIISISCLILLIIIAAKMGIFSILNMCNLFGIIKKIISNTYFSSIICSVLSVVLIYIIQVQYSKKMLKKDFRCNEIIQDIFSGIENYCELMDRIPEPTKRKDNEDFFEKRKQDSLMYYQFYKKNKIDIDLITISFSDTNNDILIDSLQSCFFLNLNFKLLNIVNNIKNRLPNLQDGYPEIEKAYEEFIAEGKEESLITLGNKLPYYLIDLRFMVIYWKELLDYLNYDPTYIKLFVQTYNSKYNIVEDIKQPKEVLYAKNREIDKVVRKAIRINKIKQFWNK